MKVSVKMPAEEFERYLRYCKDKHTLRKEIKREMLEIEQQFSQLCMLLVEGLQGDDNGTVRIRNDMQIGAALEIVKGWQQRQ